MPESDAGTECDQRVEGGHRDGGRVEKKSVETEPVQRGHRAGGWGGGRLGRRQRSWQRQRLQRTEGEENKEVGRDRGERADQKGAGQWYKYQVPGVRFTK